VTRTRGGDPGGPIPGPRGRAALRTLAGFGRDPLAELIRLHARYGDAVRVPLRPGHDLVVLARPEHAEHVLASRQDNYVKGITYEPMRAFLGDGLVTSNGPLWESQRRLVQPLFNHRRVMDLVPVMVERVGDVVAQWKTLPDGTVVDVAEEMSRLTLDLAGATLFGSDLRLAGGEIARAVGVMQGFAVRGMRNPLLIASPRLGLRTTPGHRRWRAAVETIDAVIAGLIGERRARIRAGSPPQRADLLSVLLDARGASGGGIGDRQIRDELVTFLMAGHETSATSLDWAWILLSTHPSVRRRMEDEVDAVLGDRPPAADDLPALEWTRAVVSEVLRLYPPFWTLERDTLRDDVVDGIPIRSGTTVAVPPYLVHRHRDSWPNPEGFDPNRFVGSGDLGRHRYAWIPFGGGRRGCVGNVFAATEMVVVLTMLCQGYRLDLGPAGRPTPLGAVTLQPRGGLHMVLSRRVR